MTRFLWLGLVAVCLCGCNVELWQQSQRDPVGAFVRSGLYDAYRQHRRATGQDALVSCLSVCGERVCETTCESY